ncbi:putative disease resistance protein RGA1 [Abrus precatorius]|uniref:Disease resistance protein RGA1 n=1 Tax=Abrus precatorius TaxID=3816 RepID=A0A8B8JYZ6_ABRPR|nr:putative disease resistance protein RGA1 [Abrus precatorius]XP_027336607.1 putative disease resistance protein RGA1 [Abrus precatorius]
MAEHIPFAVASNLIHRLASADFLEFGKQYDVREALEELKNTIESINDKLLDAEDKQDQDVGVRVWIRRFKKVLHQADDFLDKLAIQSTRDKLGAAEGKEVKKVLLSISSSNQIPLCSEMPDKIKEILESFNGVVKEMKDLNLSPKSRVVKKTNSEWRETCSFVLESDIIGRDDSKKEIISLLRQSHEKQTVSVIAVVGIGGLGKTALAQLVYNDLEVQNFFEMQTWVCVSDIFDVKTILKKILESITGDQIEVKISLDNLQKRLREKISGKKYLLVLDDIWNENNKKWAEVRTHLMCGAQDSKILVTTRSEIAAKTMSASTSYLLKALTEKESWSLLKKTAFEDGSKVVNQNLESMGKEIAGKCKGVPLAVKTLGGLLRGQYEESEWKDVLHGDFWKLCGEQDSIVPILKLSYQNLSPEMRQCFAYCSIYPKDWMIFKDELIQLWMAQGYLQCSTDKQCMEDIGNQYVKMFLTNSFFQDAESEDGEIISFKIHDLMHDLAMLVAGNDYCYLDSKAKKLVGRPMHVSLELQAIHLLDLLDENRLRTLILWSYDEDIEGELPVANFKYLRVLKMPCSSIVKLSASAEQLEQLRYLDLFDSAGRVSLPKFISNLVFLQTLKLGNCDESFSEDVAKLVNLRFLDIVDYDDSFTGMAVGLRKLCSLQILSIFVVGDRQEINYGTLNELKDLIRGKLRMKHLDRVRDVAWESQDVNLKQKKFLQSLTLSWSYQDICNSDSLQLLENLESHHNLKRLKVNYYPGVLFPNWLSLFTNVVDISLYAFDKCRFLPPFERLPYLMSLVIELLPELEYIYLHEDGFAETFFPSLKSLVLRGCGELRGWLKLGDDINDSQNISSPYSFPRLSHLEVSICPQLTCMPTFPNLKDLKWYQCSAEPLTETLNTTSTCSVDSSSSAAPLSMLKELEISDPINLRKGWMQNLTSLESLRIQGCHSETLEEFQTGFKDDTNCLISLQQITILGCEKLKALPDWICNLSSLQHISIFGCPKLVSLPQGMSRLTNLKIFEVDSYSLLLEECRTETSAICLPIAHIPQIILRNR